MATALDPTAMDMMAMVSINDVQLSCVYRLMLGLFFLFCFVFPSQFTHKH